MRASGAYIVTGIDVKSPRIFAISFNGRSACAAGKDA